MKNTLLTYEQWCYLFKRNAKKYIKRKIIQILEYLFSAMMLALPFWMFFDWLLRGY